MPSVGGREIYIHRGNSLPLDRIDTGHAINFNLSDGRILSECVNVVCICQKDLNELICNFQFWKPTPGSSGHFSTSLPVLCVSFVFLFWKVKGDV